MADPSFSQYWHNAEIEGAEVRKVPCQDGAHDLEAMLVQLMTKLLLFGYVVQIILQELSFLIFALRAFLAKVPSDILVVLDEAYIEYVTHPDHKDTLPIINEYPNVLLLRTFSKAYGLASFRVGFAIGQPDVIAKLDPVRAPFNNTILSQAVRHCPQ